MGPLGWRGSAEVVFVGDEAFDCEVRDRSVDVDGVPDDDGVGDEVQAERLVGLVLWSAVPDLGCVGEEDELTQSVEGFSLVELASDSAPVGFVFEVVEQEPGFGGSAEFLDGSGELVASGSGLESGDGQAGGNVAGFGVGLSNGRRIPPVDATLDPILAASCIWAE